jgi:hypothetical protein
MVGIGLFHLILGGAAVIGGGPLNATAQGEHRFFAALFACYGVAFLWWVRATETKKRDQHSGRNVPGGWAGPTSLDRNIGPAQRVLLRDARRRTRLADGLARPYFSVSAILLMANGFQLVTGCTAAPHVHHRGSPRSGHTV